MVLYIKWTLSFYTKVKVLLFNFDSDWYQQHWQALCCSYTSSSTQATKREVSPLRIFENHAFLCLRVYSLRIRLSANLIGVTMSVRAYFTKKSIIFLKKMKIYFFEHCYPLYFPIYQYVPKKFNCVVLSYFLWQ